MPEPLQIIIANRLRDGVTVFLADDGRWVEDIADARRSSSAAQATALLAEAGTAVRRNEVVDPYLIDVHPGGHGRLVPLAWRETIRACGPTVPGRQEP